jgi:hypothetical protein
MSDIAASLRREAGTIWPIMQAGKRSILFAPTPLVNFTHLMSQSTTIAVRDNSGKAFRGLEALLE